MVYETISEDSATGADLDGSLRLLQSAIPSAERDISVYWASYPTGQPNPAYAQMNIDGELVRDFGRAVEAAARKIHSLSSADLHVYEPATKLDDHEVDVLELSTLPRLRDCVATLQLQTNIPQFNRGTTFMRGLRFYAVRVSPKYSPGQTAFLLRLSLRSRQMKRSWFAAIGIDADTFADVGDTCLLFDYSVDCILIGDTIFIFNKSNFHTMFRLQELIRQEAEKVLKAIESRITIRNFDAFRQECLASYPARLKLMNIGRRPYLGTLTTARFVQAIPKYDRRLTYVSRPAEVIFRPDVPGDMWEILRLLDEDPMKGEFSRATFVSRGKVPG